jgi:hypothetical protein
MKRFFVIKRIIETISRLSAKRSIRRNTDRDRRVLKTISRSILSGKRRRRCME